ncbi:MAG: hypothetical protein K6C08_06845 [Oscillospiraceae bacterium]|nr:hypothetical protein [Oscillospiraceae bacterium]
MKTDMKRILLVLLAVLVLSSLAVTAAAQSEPAPAEEAAADTQGISLSEEEEYTPLPLQTVPYVENDTAVRGEYTPFDPTEEADSFSGVAIEGNEEEELQQERIAGGAVGEARSVLEELHGITDYSEGEYVPQYGID